MLSFIGNVFGGLLGLITGSWQSAISAVVNGIRDMFRTHYLYWHTVSGRVANGWQVLTRDVLIFEQQLQKFLFAQGAFDFWIAKRQIPWLAGWIAWLGGKIQNDLRKLRRILEQEMNAGDAKQHAYTRSVLVWVIIHVLTFLYKLLLRVFSWIDGIGATMWHYFTHLADFAELLFPWLLKSLEKHAWDAARVLGEFLLALIVHNLVKFAKLLETIVDAVL